MKLIRSVGFALMGIKHCLVWELNMRIHLCVAGAVIALSLLFDVSGREWIAICFCIAFVIIMEMLNTAIEKLCDVVHKDIHPSIKKIKDISAGAVLVAAIFSSITGTVIFLPKIIVLLKSV